MPGGWPAAAAMVTQWVRLLLPTIDCALSVGNGAARRRPSKPSRPHTSYYARRLLADCRSFSSPDLLLPPPPPLLLLLLLLCSSLRHLLRRCTMSLLPSQQQQRKQVVKEF